METQILGQIPFFRGVNGYPASIIMKGVKSCNLPDHHVTAGCTAIVALKSGNRLYVANAGGLRYGTVQCSVI
jgi:hypothetical protein